MSVVDLVPKEFDLGPKGTFFSWDHRKMACFDSVRQHQHREQYYDTNCNIFLHLQLQEVNNEYVLVRGSHRMEIPLVLVNLKKIKHCCT